METNMAGANFWLAAGCAGMAALHMALFWGYLSYLTGNHLGFLVVPIASQVGAVVRYVNKSKQGEVKFAYLGASVALLVCMAGNLLVECVQISMVYNIRLIDLVQQMNLDNALRIRSEPLQVIDVALYC